MAAQQATLGRVLILDADVARAAEFSRYLGFLNYDAVLIADENHAVSDIGALQATAVVLGDIRSASLLDKAAHEFHRCNSGVPYICFPEAAASRSQWFDGHCWSLDMPLRRSQLEKLLQRAERYQGQDRRDRLTGSSRSMRRVRCLIEQVAEFDTTVLVTGESGTGKELVARTVHQLSDRANQPFVPINCGAIPADLLESELFGHEKGSFTGAINARIGRFELAEGGTLFLDEIGDMSLPMQVKLLRVLQEKTFERIGSNKTQHCDVRIIAATHCDLPSAVAEDRFRADLFYRLNVFPIEMPPLFKRASDLPQLLNELFVSHCGGRSNDLRVTPEALGVLVNYRWPGNIRELSNLVERLAIIKPHGPIECADLPAKYRKVTSSPRAEMNTVSAAMQLAEANLKEHLQHVERDFIGQAMQVSDGVVAKAARLLSMQRTTLVEKIAKYDLG